MMLHALLCQSQRVARAVDAAADLLGGIGAEYAVGKCAAPATEAVPFIKLHGMEDPNIPFVQEKGKEVMVDGVAFLGARDTVAVRARNNGCGDGAAGPEAPRAGGEALCTDLCAKAEPASPPAVLCGMPGVKHDTDHPRPGFVYQQAFEFFNSAPAKARFAPAAAKPVPAEVKEAARSAVAKSVSEAGGAATPGGSAGAAGAPGGGPGSSSGAGGPNVAAIAGGAAAGGAVAVAAAAAAGVGVAVAKRRKRQAEEAARAAAATSSSDDFSSLADADVVMDVAEQGDGSGVIKSV
jgi:adenine/guanine phosphoribosyltransferase-like PRPP-binding protein